MKTTALLFLTILLPLFILAQSEDQKEEKASPYDLMSNYYNDNFKPFKKRNWFVGLAFGLEDNQLGNMQILMDTNLSEQWVAHY